MEFMYQIEDRLMDELKEISQKIGNGEEMTSQCLDDIKDISISLSKLATYQAMKEGDGGYSRGRSNQRRDNMGRYSRGGYSRSYGRMDDEWGREPY